MRMAREVSRQRPWWSRAVANSWRSPIFETPNPDLSKIAAEKKIRRLCSRSNEFHRLRTISGGSKRTRLRGRIAQSTRVLSLAMVVAPKLTLTYFPFAARAEPLRLAFAVGKVRDPNRCTRLIDALCSHLTIFRPDPRLQVPFSHRIVAPKDWPALKPKTPLGSIPILEVEVEGQEKQVIAESMAILRYVGKLGGLYPEDPIEALKVDSFMETATQATRLMEISVQGPVRNLLSESEWSEEEKLAIRKRIAENESGLPFHLAYFEKSLKDNGSGWLVGSKITVADLALTRISGWISGGILDGIPASILDKYPLVKAHRERIEAEPAVAEWRNKHPTPYTDFEFAG